MTHKGSATETTLENEKAYTLKRKKKVNVDLPAGEQSRNGGLVALPSQC